MFFINLPSKINNPDVITIKPINSLTLINSPIIIAFSNMDDGGIIIVQINKLPAPVDARILKYIKYANTEHITAKSKE